MESPAGHTNRSPARAGIGADRREKMESGSGGLLTGASPRFDRPIES